MNVGGNLCDGASHEVHRVSFKCSPFWARRVRWTAISWHVGFWHKIICRQMTDLTEPCEMFKSWYVFFGAESNFKLV